MASWTMFSTGAREALFNFPGPSLSFVNPPQSPRSRLRDRLAYQVDPEPSFSVQIDSVAIRSHYGHQSCHQP